MNREAQIRKNLLCWYERSQRELPWRETQDPYRIWVSEVMLQQTRVETVIPYYLRFISTFPDIDSLARADLQDVLRVWEGMGYYARARNLHRAAALVAGTQDGRLPDDPEALRRLPGIGAYIMAAVSSIAFGRPMAVVDGNVKRVLARLYAVRTPVNRPGAEAKFYDYADRLLDRRKPGTFNQAIMELGALVCLPQNPECTECPVRRWCDARRNNEVGIYPVRIQKKPVPTYRIAVGVILKNGRALITRRKEDGMLGGLWEFPGGKVLDRETPSMACEREIAEEVNLVVKAGKRVTRVRHAYTHFKIVMDVFLCRYVSGRVRLRGPVGFRWVYARQLDDFPFPAANRKFIPLLQQILDES